MFNHNSVFSHVLLLIGRILISQIFVIAALSKIVDFQYTLNLVSGLGVPLPEIALIFAIILELAGGLFLLFGWYTRFAAVILFIFVILASYFMHSYWDYQGTTKVINLQHFMKNLCISGGLFYVFVTGAGRYSLNKLFRKK